MSGTVIEDYGVDFWTAEALRPGIWPRNWCGETAFVPGKGNLYAVMNSNAQGAEQANQGIYYAFLASRLQTATDIELDYFAMDFFGSGLPRNGGEPDSSYRARIQAQLFLPQVSRNALQSILEGMTQGPVRMMEPWYLPDTMCWDQFSYWDIDNPEYPARWASPELIYQGFIECQLPPFGPNQQNPLWCWDAGFAWDAPSGYWLPFENTWFTQQHQLDAAIVRSKAEGTTIYRKYNVPLPNYTVGGTIFVPAGTTEYALTVPNIAGPIVVIVQATWNTTPYVVPISNNMANIFFPVPAPTGGGSFDYYAVPVATAGAIRVSVPNNVPSLVTISGSVTAGDTVSLTVYNPLLTGGSETLTYTVLLGATLDTIAAGLAALISGNQNLKNIETNANVVFGSQFIVNSNSSQPTTYSVTTSLGASETITEVTQYAVLFAPPEGTWGTSIPSFSWAGTPTWGGMLGPLQEFFVSDSPVPGIVGAIFFPPTQSGVQTVSADVTAVTISLPSGVLAPFGFFACADWNTQIAVTAKSTSSVTLSFSNPAPGSQNVYWSWQNF